VDALEAAQYSAFANIVSAMAAIAAAGFVAVSIRQATNSLVAQRVNSDLGSVLVIWERLDVHWCRFRESSSDGTKFEFGQLISYYELACGLFRHRIFSTKASETLREHLRDVLNQMNADDGFKRLFQDLATHPDTFAHIKWFVDHGTHPSCKDEIWIEIQRKLRSRIG
jgi:hypothetical protein